MRSDKPKKGIRSVLLAAVYCGVWLVPTVGFKLLADEVTGSLLLHVAFVMMAVPACGFGFPFVYARRGGQRGWLALYMSAAVLILYAVFGYNELQPDFIVTNILCGFFGFGIGGIFVNEPIAAAQRATDNAKKIAEAEREKNYKPIIEDNKKS